MTLKRGRSLLTPTNLLLCAGIVMTLLVSVLAGTRAIAEVDTSIRVHTDLRFDESGSLFKSSEFTPVTRGYEMRRKNVSTRTWNVTGVPLIDIFNKKYESDPTGLGKVNYVMLKNDKSDTFFKLVPMSLLRNDPPLVLATKATDSAGKNQIKSPSIVYPSTGDYKYNRDYTIPRLAGRRRSNGARRRQAERRHQQEQEEERRPLVLTEEQTEESRLDHLSVVSPAPG